MHCLIPVPNSCYAACGLLKLVHEESAGAPTPCRKAEDCDALKSLPTALQLGLG